MKKTYVLDTNVLLHDSESIVSFEENDVVIPIVVLEELDKKKNEPGEIGRNAREVARSIDRLRDSSWSSLSDKGVPIGDGLGNLKIFSDNTTFTHSGLNRSNDNYIIGCTRTLCDTIEGDVVLVTNDINMRVKADSLGVIAQPYDNDHVEIDDIASVEKIICPVGMIDNFYKTKKICIEDFKDILDDPRENGCYILEDECNAQKTALCRYRDNHLRPLTRQEQVFKVRPRNAEQSFLMDALLDEKISLVICSGVAGSGKTLLSLAAGLEHVGGKKLNGHHIDRIMITKVVQEVGNGIGYLPGDLNEKMDAWIKPFHDNLEYLLKNDTETVMDLQEKGKIEVDALTYIRGRSLMNRFVIVDEVQNLTPKEVKTLITRIGNSSKLVILGDLQQIDNPYLSKTNNGLAHAMEGMSGLSNVAVMNMTNTVRSTLAGQAAERL